MSQSLRKTVLSVEGWVTGAEVGLLEEEFFRCLQGTECLEVDLKGVKSIDRAGLGLLQRWAGKGVVLRGGSVFIRALLEKHGLLSRSV